jgi:arginase family enzyme
MDLVEVAPAYDSAQITALAGATIIWTYLSLIAHS